MGASTVTGRGPGAANKATAFQNDIKYLIDNNVAIQNSINNLNSENSTRIKETNFSQASLTDNVLDVSVEFKPLIVQVWNNENQMIIPDDIERTDNSISITLSSFTPITGTWKSVISGVNT